MAFTVTLRDGGLLGVDADEHRREGAWHVFRRTATVMGRPRTVVALRLSADGVAAVAPAATPFTPITANAPGVPTAPLDPAARGARPGPETPQDPRGSARVLRSVPD